MENIKTDFDKLMAQFNESVTHSAPKKLSFDNMNDTKEDSGIIFGFIRNNNITIYS